jgi:release factor glutamine methyltransferase
MTIGEWLSIGQLKLSDAGVTNPRLDLLLMLELSLQKNRASILANLDNGLSETQQNKLDAMLEQRTLRKPMAYILGKKEFYGRPFIVNSSVLIPRPESEAFIDEFKELKQNQNSLLLDIGTGSGCLAITAKLEIPKTEVYATDISEQAIETAKKNTKIHNAEVNFSVDDLFPKGREKFNIIFANLPYVPTTLSTKKELSFEPKEALYAGNDGLETIARMLAKIADKLESKGFLLCESLLDQHKKVEEIAVRHNLELAKTNGLVQVYKLID